MKSLLAKTLFVGLTVLSLSGCVFVDHRGGYHGYHGYRGGYHHSRW
jgi:hypothetical protein